MATTDSTLTGLTKTQATQRLHEDGPNEVAITAFNFKRAILSRLWEPSAWILEGALLVEIGSGKFIQAGFIILMLLFAAVTGAIQARRAQRVLQSLSNDLTPTAAVKRSDQWLTIPVNQLVRGDLVSLRRGDIIPADVDLLTASLTIDESSITGESTAVQRERHATAYAGTTILSGHSLATVTATGAASRAGKTISLLNQHSAPGHLQQLLGKIIGYLALLDTILAVLLLITAIFRRADLVAMLPFLAMLFIATIPIAMPSSFAVANSVEAQVLSQQHVLVSDLSGIQEAANLNLLLLDKTGTITMNRPEVQRCDNFSSKTDQWLLEMATSAVDQQHPSVVDNAILNAATQQHLTPLVPVKFSPFDATIGYAAAIVNTGQGHVSVKLGSWQRLAAMATNSPTLPTAITADTNRTVAVMVADQLMGVFMLQDQPRPDSAAAIQSLQQRGVQVIMLTGDHPKTAEAVAKAVNLTGKVLAYHDLTPATDLTKLAGIAAVTPENKLAIVQQFQQAGYIVGMTGDGVNDAPALKQAEVGIAVNNAVDLAKRSAKVVLMTPGLSTLVQLLDSGHRVYQRMMTWTITKLSRTAELTLLLTGGYLWLNRVPLALNALILVAILNDLVTLVLGTDRTSITTHPEHWNLSRLARLAGGLAAGWTLVGFGLLAGLLKNGTPLDQLSTALYVYLVFSAMLTILITRTTTHFWQQQPSRAVLNAVLLNCVLTIGLGLTGWGIVGISLKLLVIPIVAALITGLVLDVLWVNLQK